MNTAQFKFDDALKVFLKNFNHKTLISYTFNDNQSVKHLVEAMGIPHTEVGTILANGNRVSTGYFVANQDVIEIFPAEEYSSWAFPPSFILDNHLGRLAAFLRMLGFDSLYHNDYQDEELAEIASLNNRVLLTRDLRLLMRKSIRMGYWLRSKDPKTQIVEVVNRFKLADLVEPFKRCMRCNTLLVTVEKAQVLSQLQPLTRKYFDEFRWCPDCNQAYWPGSHYDRMMAFINQISHQT